MKKELTELWREYPLKKSLVIDYSELQKFGPTGIYYADKLLQRPRPIMADFENSLYELSPKEMREDLVRNVSFRFKNIPRKLQIRQLRSSDLNRLLAFDGVVRQVTQVKPKISTAVFKCQNCGDAVRVPQRTTKLEYPTEGTCRHCGEKAKWQIDLENSRYVNCQKVVVQEFQEGLKAAEQPYSIEVELNDDLCSLVNAGSRCTISGIPRVIEKDKRQLGVDTIIEGNWVDLGEQSYTDMTITEEDESAIRKLASDPSVLDVLSGGVAPSVFGHDTVKQAITLQLFGGVDRQRGVNRTRGDIHILLFGDPGIAKSQLLDFVAATSPRGVSSSGGQVTNAGLTCAAKQNSDGDWILEGGALVLADGGHCCIDEFDKMNKDDRASIHKAMEQQRLEVSKAGLNAILKTRCSILAAANPKAGRWDPYGNITEQIDLPPSLLSRFDLIFIMRDVPEQEQDEAIAKHILNGGGASGGLDETFIRKYVAYAKRNYRPERSKECNDAISKFYVRLRGLNRDGSVPITARKLEDLKRLSEASARMRLHEEADIADAQTAIRIVEACLREVAFDARTGKYDIDRVISNVSGKQRGDIAVVHNAIKVYGQAMSMGDVYNAVMDRLTKEQVDVAIEKMSQNAMVSISPDKKVTLI